MTTVGPVSLTVADLPRALAFYTKRLGFRIHQEGGAITMTTDPLDLPALLEEGVAIGSAWRGLPEDTVLGHVHLRVAHIAPAERFYCDVLGFDLTVRYGTMASFVSAAQRRPDRRPMNGFELRIGFGHYGLGRTRRWR